MKTRLKKEKKFLVRCVQREKRRRKFFFCEKCARSVHEKKEEKLVNGVESENEKKKIEKKNDCVVICELNS